jgi:hypothetical protein
MIAKGLTSTGHPVMAHIIPMRRCNLACAYCNEYDSTSQPVALAVMRERVDHLARLGTTIITISGGEPILYPELDELIGHIRSQGIIAGLITNGYLLTAGRIERLNRAGLDHMQISIDNVMPDEVSKKSLKNCNCWPNTPTSMSTSTAWSAAASMSRRTPWWWRGGRGNWVSPRPQASFTTAMASRVRSRKKSARSC